MVILKDGTHIGLTSWLIFSTKLLMHLHNVFRMDIIKEFDGKVMQQILRHTYVHLVNIIV